MCKQLISAKKHELWFVFARRPLRFSLQEYYAVTGLKYEDDGNYDLENWVDDNGFWGKLLKRGGNICLKTIKDKHIPNANRWTRVDRLRLVYLCVIAGVLMAKDEKVAISHDYIKLVMDFDKLRAYPWGLHSYDHLLESIISTRVKLGRRDSYVLEGFSFAFQIWIMEAIPDLGIMLGKKLNKVSTVSPRCSNWSGAGRIFYEQIISLENLFISEDVLYPYISSTGNMDVLDSTSFTRDSEMRDERVDRLKALIRDEYDWSTHIWEVEPRDEASLHFPDQEETEAEAEVEVETESADDDVALRTPCAEDRSASSSKSGKRKVTDHGAETRKQQLLCKRSKRGVVDDDMKSFLRGLFHDLEAKLVKENQERFGKLESEFSQLKGEVSALKDLVRSATSQKNIGEPPTSSKVDHVNHSQPKGKVKNNVTLETLHDVNVTQSSEIDMDLSTQAFLHQKIGELSQDSFVPEIDPSQHSHDEDLFEWKTPSTSLQPVTIGVAEKITTPLVHDLVQTQPGEQDPDNQLVYVSDESWEQLQQWSMSPTNLQIGPSVFNPELSKRVVGPKIWLMNQEIDAVMYLFREKTSLRRWNVERVGFMSYTFATQIKMAHRQWLRDKKKFELDALTLAYGTGELPSHGRTNQVWDVDISRIYVPVCVGGNHWISVCISFDQRTVEVFDCSGRKKIREMEAFANMVPSIVKAVQTTSRKKHLSVAPYSVVYVPMARYLNASGCDCGVYALKFIECHVLGLDLSLVDDENIREARHRIAFDLLQAARDPELVARMSQYTPPQFAPSEVVEL